MSAAKRAPRMIDGSPLPPRSCWFCEHFRHIPDPDWPFVGGQCRRRAPTRKGFPEVSAEGTCGQFKQRKP